MHPGRWERCRRSLILFTMAPLFFYYYHTCRRQGGELKDGPEIYQVLRDQFVPESPLHNTAEGGIEMVSEAR